MSDLLDQTIQQYTPQAQNNQSLLDQTIMEFGPKKEQQRIVTFDEEGAPIVNAKGYSQNDLVKDEYFTEIKDYMRYRFGSQILEGSREDIVNKFLNNMRGFAAGNSVRAGMEIGYLNSLENSKEKEATQRAYALYEGMESLFGGDMTLEERGELVKDYVGTTLFDPINLLTFGIGKIASSSGTKLATNVAQKQATKAMAASISAGATKEMAKQSAAKVFAAATQKQAQQSLKTIVQREAVKKASEKTFKNWAMKEGIEIATVGGLEGVVAATTDIMYQDAMMRMLVQEEHNYAQTGIAAVASLVTMGVISGVSQKFAREATIIPEQLKNTAEKINLTEWTKSLKAAQTNPTKKEVLKNLGPDPKEYTFERIELEDLDSEFFIKFLLGDKDNDGIKGIAQVLAEQGYGYRPRQEGDKITFWIGDIIEEQDPSDFRNVLSAFTDATGIRIKGLEDVDNKQFAKLFKEKISMQGSVLNAVSQMSRIFGVESSRVTLDDYYEFALTGSFSRLDDFNKESGKIGKFVGKFTPDIPENSIPAVQNRLIRLLVSNLSTTQLNITGYSAASAMNSISDIALGVALSSGKTLRKAVTGKGTWKSATKDITDALSNTRFKLQNTLDMNTTLDQFKAYGLARPQAVKELQRIIPGGVENIEKVTKGFDPDMTMLGIRTDEAIGIIQQLNLVTAQDAYTKSIEFITQLDKGLRKQYNMGYNEFFKSADYKARMATKEYALLELKAADETLSSIFSKSFKSPTTTLGELAGFIEDARNIPGLGMLVPFGRFFNNTIAFMADNSGISLTLRTMGLMKRKGSTYTDAELAARTAVTWAGILALVPDEEEYIKKGYSWSQEDQMDNSGAVIQEKYEFPYAAYKAVARIIAHHRLEESPPEEMLVDIGDTFFGQFTRNLSESGEGAMTFLTTLLSGEREDILPLAGDVAGKLFSQGVSMGARFIAPINDAVGLARGEEYKNIDTKQGASVFREATRYMNQIIDSTFDMGYEERFSPSQGKVQSQATKNFSTARETELTDIERIYNMAGLPSYKAGVRTDFAGAKNRYARLYSQLNESAASALLKDDRFRNAKQEARQLRLLAVMEKNKKTVKQYMASNRAPDDLESKLVIEIDSEYKDDVIRKALQELNLEEDLDGLTYEQLLTVESYLSFRDSKIMREYNQ